MDDTPVDALMVDAPLRLDRSISVYVSEWVSEVNSSSSNPKSLEKKIEPRKRMKLIEIPPAYANNSQLHMW